MKRFDILTPIVISILTCSKSYADDYEELKAYASSYSIDVNALHNINSGPEYLALQKLAEQGNSYAIFYTAKNIYGNSRSGEVIKYRRAFNRFKLLEANGDKQAAKYISKLEEDFGFDFAKFNKNIQKLRMQSLAGDLKSTLKLARFYYRGESVPKDYDEALRLAKLAWPKVRLGEHAELFLDLYSVYNNRDFDQGEVKKMVTKAAESGDVRAMILMQKVERNKKRYWERKALNMLMVQAKQGSSQAQYILSSEFKSQKQWLDISVENENADALLSKAHDVSHTANIYNENKNAKEQFELVLNLLERAHKAGNRFASGQLGAMYSYGHFPLTFDYKTSEPIVSPDIQKGLEWYSIAAHYGYGAADLGELYYELGKFEQAYFWSNIGFRYQGSRHAYELEYMSAQKISADNISLLERHAFICVASDYTICSIN
ncbi:tetratricopeptide repeat protein [Vibrio sp. TRT 21S02]|uniref:tetratricopeptide repeat protein n=1 Tax=Vibrio sp. TRT 21S02 TaxID=3418507 RepID=UPI003CF46E7B